MVQLIFFITKFQTLTFNNKPVTDKHLYLSLVGLNICNINEICEIIQH